MSKDEYYDEELAYEAQIEKECRRFEREEDEWDKFEDEYQRNGFRDEADYNNYRYGASRFL